MIDICTLGTGGAIPMPDRALSSMYLRVDGHALLLDCGEGTQTQIRRLGWGFLCIEGMLITHFHGDHVSGLPGFLLSLDKAGRTKSFPIYGPVGLRRIVEGLMVIAPNLSFPLELHELPMHGGEFSLIGLNITAFQLDHGVPCFGYRIELRRIPRFEPQRARALNVPMPLWGRLQAGESVKVDGSVVTPDQVLGAARKGLSILYATDTRPVPEIVEHGRGADLMILEGMYGDDDKLPQAHKNHHMLFREAAALAREAEAKTLILTHFSNCIEDANEYAPNAQSIFENTIIGTDLGTHTLRFERR